MIHFPFIGLKYIYSIYLSNLPTSKDKVALLLVLACNFMKEKGGEMKYLKNPLKHKKKEMIFIPVMVLLIALFFSGYSMGKESSNTKVEANSKIAEPILTVENDPTIEIDGKNREEQYHFKVKNYRENGETTQIDLMYHIEILTQTNQAISFKLYKEGQEIPLENNKTQTMKMPKKQIQEDKYQLKIIYDKTQKSSLEEILQDIQIKVHSEQMKG